MGFFDLFRKKKPADLTDTMPAPAETDTSTPAQPASGLGQDDVTAGSDDTNPVIPVVDPPVAGEKPEELNNYVTASGMGAEPAIQAPAEPPVPPMPTETTPAPDETPAEPVSPAADPFSPSDKPEEPTSPGTDTTEVAPSVEPTATPAPEIPAPVATDDEIKFDPDQDDSGPASKDDINSDGPGSTGLRELGNEPVTPAPSEPSDSPAPDAAPANEAPATQDQAV